ncbi:hypothetical protein ACG33_04890 [Steroidobacter denitrificans]|uniref:Uncharacterized protein n=1 Tax=Steroidobacter denitrificans TaxID=465721 RepID=A0A127FA18_STEDE|nr:DUF6516 family protein [Steroidobacter denitrificans]AMN46448.1 hypothetical protein ACG33_04890 [Steroidobacter denitrificans]
MQRERFEFDDGAVVEMVVWLVPSSVPGSAHHFKYRLYYGVSGKRVIGYDNERPKGDHRHEDGREEAYEFRGLEQLVADFLADVERKRAGS